VEPPLHPTEDVSNVPSLYATLHPDKEVRDAAEDCDQKFSALNTELNQNVKIFARLKAYVPTNPRQAKLKRDLMQGFEDSGAALAPDKRAPRQADPRQGRRAAHHLRAQRARRSHQGHLHARRDGGLPEAYLKARKADGNGNYNLGLDQPSYVPFMSNAKSGAARERYYRARNQQGGARNLEILHEEFLLRQELAALYGVPTFADYVTRRAWPEAPPR
jgi:thimet oligopeptidase